MTTPQGQADSLSLRIRVSVYFLLVIRYSVFVSFTSYLLSIISSFGLSRLSGLSGLFRLSGSSMYALSSFFFLAAYCILLTPYCLLYLLNLNLNLLSALFIKNMD